MKCVVCVCAVQCSLFTVKHRPWYNVMIVWCAVSEVIVLFVLTVALKKEILLHYNFVLMRDAVLSHCSDMFVLSGMVWRPRSCAVFLHFYWDSLRSFKRILMHRQHHCVSSLHLSASGHREMPVCNVLATSAFYGNLPCILLVGFLKSAPHCLSLSLHWFFIKPNTIYI